MARVSDFFRGFFRQRTRVKVSLGVLILGILIALLLPALQPARQSGHGHISFPIRVLVFNSVQAKPIANAHVSIIEAPAWLGTESPDDFRNRFPPHVFDRSETTDLGRTASDGTVVIDYRFRTSYSDSQPKAALLYSAWVVVQADGYGGTVVPVRHDWQPVTALREQKELLVPVGLMPAKRMRVSGDALLSCRVNPT